MLVDFKELSNDSRIWIYQSNRKLSEEESVEIEKEVAEFLTQWTAHGATLQAGFEIRYNRFIVIGLDQESVSASGCSIDASVHFVQSLEQKYDIDLLDKMNVTYYNGEYIAYKSLKDFRQMAKNKSVSKNTVVFNNLVNTKAEYIENWEVPAHQSWHGRFMS